MGKFDAPEEPQQGAPEWIVTFSDMISLLVTFFVMLMSFSTMEDNEAAIIVGAFGQSKGGVLQQGPNSAVPEPENDRLLSTNPLRGADRPHARPPEELPENLENMGQKTTDEHVEVDFSAVTDGLLITFDERASFAPGSAEVNPALKKSLHELAQVLEHYSHLIVIEGFTDDHVAPTPRFADAQSLSAERAANAAHAMLDKSKLARDLIQVAGLGSARPRASNESASGRTQNRRVEIRVMSLSKARERALKAEFQAQKAKER